MTTTISNVAISTDTFGGWVVITNQMATAFRSNTVTVDSAPGGSLSTGNGYVNGYFGANTLYAVGNLRGGTGTTAANLVISTNTTIQGNVNITGTSLNVGGTLFTINSSSISTTANVVFDGDLTINGTLTSGVSAEGDIIPSANNTYDLGNTQFVFNSTYTSNATIYDRIIIGGTIINATSYTGTATSALSANNSTYLNGQLASYYTNAGNLTGTLPYNVLGTNVINTTANFTISGVHTHNANVSFGSSARLIANSSGGSSGQILTSNGTGLYWSSPTPSVAGSTTQVQYNDGGALAGAAGLTFNKTTNNVTMANTLVVTSTVNATSFNASSQANASTLRATSSLDVASAITGNSSGVFTTGRVNAASFTTTAAPADIFHVKTANGYHQFFFEGNDFPELTVRSTANNSHGAGLLLQLDPADGANTQNDDLQGYIYSRGYHSSNASAIGGSAEIHFFQDGSVTSNGIPGAIRIYTSDGSDFSSGGERMRIAANGNIGIGTTAPTAKLDVYSSGYPGIRHIIAEGNYSSIYQKGSEWPELDIEAVSNTTASGIHIKKTRGTYATNANTQTNDLIGFISFVGENANTTVQNGRTAEIRSFQIGAVQSSGIPGILTFYTSDGSSTWTAERMRITDNGNIGIGTGTPAYKLDVTGDIRATGTVYSTSDIAYKENIEPIGSASSIISKLNGVSYNFKTDGRKQTHYGFIAQEVEKILPTIVSGEEGNKSLGYLNIIALLVESVKELSGRLEKLEN